MSNGGTIGLMIANIFGGALLVKAIGGKNTMTVGAICELAAGIVWLLPIIFSAWYCGSFRASAAACLPAVCPCWADGSPGTSAALWKAL